MRARRFELGVGPRTYVRSRRKVAILQRQHGRNVSRRAALIVLAWVAAWLPVVAHAEEPAAASEPDYDALAEMDLSELLAAPTAVASTRATSVRQSPAVLTIVTREGILTSGARDLVDILQLVPGFFIGVDVEGTLASGTRGLWGEGKILYLLDGHPMNEMSYSVFQVGGRMPVELIERIEIIRGPGSARYGGYAELGVVNIVLLEAPEQGTRAYASFNYGQQQRAYGRQNLSLAFTRRSEAVKDLTLEGRAYLSQAHPSDRRHRSLLGDEYDMVAGNRWRQSLATLGVGYKGLQLKYLFENYRVRNRDGYGEVTARALEIEFISHHLSAQVAFKPHKNVTVTPLAEYHRQFPYNTQREYDKPAELFSPDELADFIVYSYDRLAERTVLGLRTEWSVFDELTLSFGGQLQGDRAQVRHYNPEIDNLDLDLLYRPGDLTATFYNVVGFAEASTENRWLNVTAGARYEHHSRFGSAFAPRLALGRIFGDFHVKALASQAFRSPGFENLNLGANIKPERTATFEIETGYQLTRSLLLAVNAFDLTVSDPIIYFYDTINEKEGYVNRGRTGSRGVEAELRFQTSRVRTTGSYAFYTARHKNTVPDYAVPKDHRALLGAPSHKVAFNGNVWVWGPIHVSASAFVLSKRYAQVGIDSPGDPVIGTLAPVFVLNLFVEYRDLMTKGLAIGIGGYNVTGQSFAYPQAYKTLRNRSPAGGHAAMASDSTA